MVDMKLSPLKLALSFVVEDESKAIKYAGFLFPPPLCSCSGAFPFFRGWRSWFWRGVPKETKPLLTFHTDEVQLKRSKQAQVLNLKTKVVLVRLLLHGCQLDAMWLTLFAWPLYAYLCVCLQHTSLLEDVVSSSKRIIGVKLELIAKSVFLPFAFRIPLFEKERQTVSCPSQNQVRCCFPCACHGSCLPLLALSSSLLQKAANTSTKLVEQAKAMLGDVAKDMQDVLRTEVTQCK